MVYEREGKVMQEIDLARDDLLTKVRGDHQKEQYIQGVFKRLRIRIQTIFSGGC